MRDAQLIAPNELRNDPDVPDRLKEMPRADIQRLLMLSTDLVTRFHTIVISNEARQTGVDPVVAAQQNPDPFRALLEQDIDPEVAVEVSHQAETLLLEQLKQYRLYRASLAGGNPPHEERNEAAQADELMR